MSGFTIGVLRANLLLGGIHLHGNFAGHIRRSLSDDLADLAHGSQLFREPRVFRSVLAADAAPRIVARLLIGALSAALAFGALAALGVIARLPVLRV